MGLTNETTEVCLRTSSADEEMFRTLSENASRWTLGWSRRVLDWTVASLVLILLLPLMLLIAVLVRLDSPGPALFCQKRMGRNGVEFVLFKFRSMHSMTNAGSSITAGGDARVTRIGYFLRRFKLDELPQFWNVVRGEMSLVGPRPKLAHLEPLHLVCRPGITGCASLAFRGEESLLSEVHPLHVETFYNDFIMPAKAALDAEYMRTATPLSDLRILFLTGAFWIDPPKHSSILDIEEEIARAYRSRLKTQGKSRMADALKVLEHA